MFVKKETQMFIWFWLYSQKILQQKLRRDTRAPPAGSSSEPCSSLSHLYADFKKSFLNHSHPVGHSSFFFFLHTCIHHTTTHILQLMPSLIKHALNNRIMCKTHTHARTHTLTKCKVTHLNTGLHTVGPGLSEAVAVGLWSSEAWMVRTVAVLDRERWK